MLFFDLFYGYQFLKYTVYTIKEFELYELLQDSISIESVELKVKI